MRTIAAVTVARSDYGIYLPLFRRMQADPHLRLRLIVAGGHLSPEFGLTVRAIEEDGFEIADRIEMLLSSDTPEGIAKSMGLGVLGFAHAYAGSRPDLLLVLGDRFEMLAAVAAAQPFRIPVAHVHGGESSEGAIDECFRHAITKMSHLHFVSTETYRRRVVQMGEEPWRVVVSGAPSLDNLHDTPALTRREFDALLGAPLPEPFLLVTFHPTEREPEQAAVQCRELLAALELAGRAILFTYPGADASSRRIIGMIEEFAGRSAQARLAVNLGTRGYFAAMQHAGAMVGNSSSGIIEAASFQLPVVNVGDRQRGRVRAGNVIDVGYEHREILDGIERALSSEFRAALTSLANPYGEGRAAGIIVDHLKSVKLDALLLLKRFHELRCD